MPRKTHKTPQPNLNPTKFILYNFAGQEKAHYLVERKPLNKNTAKIEKPTIAHSIIIIDRSGSMYYDIEPLKETLIKLLTLDEYINSQLLITLISYSSKRDVTCHFQRIPITEVMKSNSAYLQAIKKIKVTGCTCISQSMEIAKSLIAEYVKPGEKGELTAITLHSDGYANDPSYPLEIRSLEAICNDLKMMNVFVNTISYSQADFKLLAKIANTVSGSCLQAGNVKDIYDSLYQTSKLLNSSVTPPIEEPLIKGYDYQVFVSKSAKKVNGSSATLKILGLKPEDDGLFYKYQKISPEEFNNLTDVPIAQTDESVFAFIKANLAQGNINTAKYALVSSLDATLIEKHAKALTNSEIIDFTQAIEQVIFEPSVLNKHRILEQVKISDKITLLELFDLLEQQKNHIIITFKNLKKNYSRKGLKRLQGARDENGNLITPWLKTKPIDGGEYVQMGTFEINRNTATINMLITRKVKLVKQEDEEQIAEVAGILVNDLKVYNNYTLVSDGEINVKSLKVKINNQQTFDLLKKEGVLEKEGQAVEQFDFRTEYEIRLDNLPLVAFDGQYESLNGVFEELAKHKILSSIISAHLKEESDLYTPEQLAELKKHYLSKNLYLNFPTTTEYRDLKEALNQGTVDTRVSYKIEIGNLAVLNLSKLPSANKFLDRLYQAYHQDSGEKIEKPTFELTLDEPIVFQQKTLSSRTKLTEIDELMRPIFDSFLGIEDNGSVQDILSRVGAESLVKLLQAKWKGEKVNREEFITALTQAKIKLDNYGEKLYRQKVCPLVFYIGSTGLLPDDMDAKAMTAEELNAKYPDLKISKNEQDGMFFEVGNNLITVYTTNEYFSIT